MRGPTSTWKGGREGGRGKLNEEARVAASCQRIKVPGGGREMEGRGSIGKGWMAGGTGRLDFIF